MSRQNLKVAFFTLPVKYLDIETITRHLMQFMITNVNTDDMN